MSVQAWTYLFISLSFGLYLFIAWRSRVRDTSGFYVAGRGVPAVANGMTSHLPISSLQECSHVHVRCELQ